MPYLAFIIHGDADTTNPCEQSRDLNKYLSQVGANVEFLEIPGEKHGCTNHIPEVSEGIARYSNKAWKLTKKK